MQHSIFEGEPYSLLYTLERYVRVPQRRLDLIPRVHFGIIETKCQREATDKCVLNYITYDDAWLVWWPVAAVTGLSS